MADGSNVKVTASVEAVITKTLREIAETANAESGLRILDVTFEWDVYDTLGGNCANLRSVKMITCQEIGHK